MSELSYIVAKARVNALGDEADRESKRHKEAFPPDPDRMGLSRPPESDPERLEAWRASHKKAYDALDRYAAANRYFDRAIPGFLKRMADERRAARETIQA